MLQVCNGNFLFTDEVYKTTHRAPLYTNLRFPDDEINLGIGVLSTTSYFLPLTTLIAEIHERQPAKDSNGEMSVFIATTGIDIMNDLSIVISFYFNGICTPSFTLADKILSHERMPGTSKKISDYVQGFFDKSVIINQEQVEKFKIFFKKLLNLPRKTYNKAIKAIRRYVTALWRISDDLDASYALFVASIESLSQELVEYETNWKDVEDSKRKDFEKVLIGIGQKKTEEIKEAIIKHEHLALSRKFCNMVMTSLDYDFYQPQNDAHVSGKNELNIAIKNAYNLRSKYVHILLALPDAITMPHNFSYCVEIDRKPYLSFNGLSIVNRQVLIKFIESSSPGEKEHLDPIEYTPGMIMMRMSEIYWMGNANALNKNSYLQYLEAVLFRIESILAGGEAKIPDMNPVLNKIGNLLVTEKGEENILILFSTLILLSRFFNFRLDEKHAPAIEKHNDLFVKKHVLVLLINTLCKREILEPVVFYQAFISYTLTKYHKHKLKLSEFYESLICANLINHLKKDNHIELADELKDYLIFNTPNSPIRKSLNNKSPEKNFDIESFLQQKETT